jgi:hypothetical protein
MTNPNRTSQAVEPFVDPKNARTRTRIAASLVVFAAIAIEVVLEPGLCAHLQLAPLRYDVIGVDVSHHQGRIDWKALADDGRAFAYIKAAEGEREMPISRAIGRAPRAQGYFVALVTSLRFTVDLTAFRGSKSDFEVFAQAKP